MADTVPAMLEPGEFVIRRDAAQELGPSLLNRLNNADRVSYRGGGYADRPENYSLLDLTMPLLNQRLGDVRGYQAGGFATSAEGIFEEQGLEYDPEYAETIQAYDPLREQNLLRQQMGTAPSPYQQTGGFGGTGFEMDTTARNKQMQQYMGGVAGYRADYRSGVEEQMAQDIASGTFEFQSLSGDGTNTPPQNPSMGEYWTNAEGVQHEWNGDSWVSEGGG